MVGAVICLAAWLVSEILIQPERRSAAGVAFSPAGDRLATVSQTEGDARGTITVWDGLTGRGVVSITAPDRPVSLAFAPDEKALAIGGWGGTVTVHDPVNGRMLRSFAGHEYPVRGLGFTPDGRLLAGGASDGVVIVWDATTGRERMRFERMRDFPVNSMSISNDGRLLAAAGGLRGGSSMVWDLETGQPIARKSLLGIRDPVAFAGEHDVLAGIAAGAAGSVQLLDLERDQVRSTLATRNARAIAFSADGRLFAAGGDDELVTVWDVSTARLVASFDQHRQQPRPMMEDNFRSFFHTLGLAKLRSLNTVWSVAFSPDGSRVASASQDGSVWIRTLPGRTPAGVTDQALLLPPGRSSLGRSLRIILPFAAVTLLAFSVVRRSSGKQIRPSMPAEPTARRQDPMTPGREFPNLERRD